MRQILWLSVVLLLSADAWANNIRVSKDVRVIGFNSAADTAIVEFDISWENSWRDDFNWDAAWVFLKYKRKGALEEWYHAYLGKEGHAATATSGNTTFSFMAGEIGSGVASKVTGLFMMRDQVSEGDVSAKVRLKWPIKTNSGLPLAQSDFGDKNDQILIAAYAVETVYLPVGAYYLGDDKSYGSFKKNGTAPIAAKYDIVDNVSGYSYTLSKAATTGQPSYVADRSNQSIYPNGSLYFFAPASLQIDFKSPREIKYFGISGASNYPECTPSGAWYLKGSNDGTTWKTLYTGGDNDWTCSVTSYPVQKPLKVTDPGSYRYYQVEVAKGKRGDNGIVIQNIAMMEEDLFSDGYVFVVETENQIALGTELMASDGTADWNSGTLPVDYPKGYTGSYMMKYEVSQEQYVEFLNTLTLSQQRRRVQNNDFGMMKRGDYVFGENLKKASARNGIVYIMSKGEGAPVVFGNNLNRSNEIGQADDGQTLACNYMSPADMLAYCDWSGLRPMSELEYEKACRRPYPQLPEQGEYAWNNNAGIKRLAALSDLKEPGTEREAPADYTRNVNSSLTANVGGPVRCGSFSTSRTGQVEAGATYWGVMEMSGNLWEMCYTANTAGRGFKGSDLNSSHGNGSIVEGGSDVPAGYWPGVQEAFAVRGGCFSGQDIWLSTSDRTKATGKFFTSMNQRESTVGFRGVRSVLNTSGFTAGNIYCENGTLQDTVCIGAIHKISGEPAENAVGKLTYIWYRSDNGQFWSVVENANGEHLTYEQFVNTSSGDKTILFKRKAICAMGEMTTSPVTLIIRPVLKAPVISGPVNAGIGYKFKFPCPYSAGMRSKWISPSGVERVEPNVIIDEYLASNDGVYKICYVDQAGCESDKVNITVTGLTDGVPLVNYGSYRGWADGSFARSANTYLHPEAPYVYKGATGNGIYRIHPQGSVASDPMNVQCDMTNNGGGWVLVFKNIWRANEAQYYWADKDPRAYNVANPDADMYSILYLMEDFKTTDGLYYYWLDYPELRVHNIWKQSANPESFDNTPPAVRWAPGYKAVEIQRTENNWGGLSKGTLSCCYLEGTFGHQNWYYTIGNKYLWGTSMPGPQESVKQVYLWMKDE